MKNKTNKTNKRRRLLTFSCEATTDLSSTRKIQILVHWDTWQGVPMIELKDPGLISGCTMELWLAPEQMKKLSGALLDITKERGT